MVQFLQESALPLYNESIEMIGLSRQCTVQIHDIYNLRYHFDNSLPLIENLCKFV